MMNNIYMLNYIKLKLCC